MNASVYDQERLEKISKIVPTFSKIAQKGDVVYMGLEGDPAFPFSKQNRPSAVVHDVSSTNEGINVELKMPDGKIQSVSEYSIHPNQVWEFEDETFKNVLKREEAKVMQMSRSESQLDDPKYSKLQDELAAVKQELAFEKNYTRDFHNTYINTLRELTNDILSLDSNRQAKFSRTFRSEYDLLKSRSEESSYRGAEEEEDLSSEEEESDGDNDYRGQSDFF